MANRATAKQFIGATNVLQGVMHEGDDEGPSVPFAVLAAFLAELLLECLKAVEGDAFLKVHDLSQLFRDLSDESRATILEKHRDLAAEHYRGAEDADELFERMLEEVSSLFIDGRYFFDLDLDDERDQRYWFANPAPIIEAVRRALLGRASELDQGTVRLTFRSENIP